MLQLPLPSVARSGQRQPGAWLQCHGVRPAVWSVDAAGMYASHQVRLEVSNSGKQDQLTVWLSLPTLQVVGHWQLGCQL